MSRLVTPRRAEGESGARARAAAARRSKLGRCRGLAQHEVAPRRPRTLVHPRRSLLLLAGCPPPVHVCVHTHAAAYLYHPTRTRPAPSEASVGGTLSAAPEPLLQRY
jgi:hypothetical protein